MPFDRYRMSQNLWCTQEYHCFRVSYWFILQKVESMIKTSFLGVNCETNSSINFICYDIFVIFVNFPTLIANLFDREHPVRDPLHSFIVVVSVGHTLVLSGLIWLHKYITQ